MSPDLIFFTLRSLLRVGSAAQSVLEQQIRDAAIDLPPPAPDQADPLDVAIKYFRGDYRSWVAPGGALHAHWDAVSDVYKPTPEAKAAVIDAVFTIKRTFASPAAGAGSLSLDQLAAEGDGVVLLQQWKTGEAPDPWARIATTLAGVALDYVALDPGLFASGARGEKLVAALAANLQGLLPKLDAPGQADFVERLAAIVLQAGLETLAKSPDLVIGQKPLQDLLRAMTLPLAQDFARSAPDDVLARIALTRLRDDVLPRMVAAGLDVVAQNQRALLGAAFDPAKTAGALTQAFLAAVQGREFATLAQPEGWVPVYQALLRGVAARAEAVIPGTGAPEDFYRGVLSKVAIAAAGLRPLAPGWEVAIVVAALEGLNDNLPFRVKTPWADLAGTAIQQFVGGLGQGLNAGTPLESIFTPELFTGLVKLVLAKVAATPGMLTGDGQELRSLTATLAAAFAADTTLLVSPEGWKTIVATLLDEAARNPGRLFGLDGAAPEQHLATRIVARILAQAETALKVSGRADGAVLLGDTLADAICETLKVAAGNADRAAKNLPALDALLVRLNALAVAPADRIGAREWLFLFRTLVAGALDTGTLPASDADLRKLLYRSKGTP
ncbi:hypothetical protein [Aquabacter spiritensis]|uniref:Uncharacterized protein n=1 Tax=Aquabacter spiritensis TaxID=933073 RepID=A0A4V2UX77_9HYPH|nr:hypothetical protein [Aquabacter spiritensis]TCT02368.1 hypothetical protein EDC64_11311 [Aquabacter spiritensis]